MRKRLLRLLLPALVVPTAGVVALTATSSSPVSALCIESPVKGDWRNIDAATRSITRVNITQGCDDVRLCDTDGNCSGGTGAFFDISTYGKCSPTDCAWGTRRLADAGDGWLRATYAFGFKSSTVWVKTYPYYGRTYLRVWVHNDFTPADGRADYTTDEWFLE